MVHLFLLSSGLRYDISDSIHTKMTSPPFPAPSVLSLSISLSFPAPSFQKQPIDFSSVLCAPQITLSAEVFSLFRGEWRSVSFTEGQEEAILIRSGRFKNFSKWNQKRSTSPRRMFPDISITPPIGKNPNRFRQDAERF